MLPSPLTITNAPFWLVEPLPTDSQNLRHKTALFGRKNAPKSIPFPINLPLIDPSSTPQKPILGGMKSLHPSVRRFFRSE